MKIPELMKAEKFLPVLNIPRKDFAVKTEVKYAFQTILGMGHASSTPPPLIDCLTFRDDLETEFLERSEYVLVDHHESPWLQQTVAIYDHRPCDNLNRDLLQKQCEVNITQVGSCATLIAELFINDEVLLDTIRRHPQQIHPKNSERLTLPLEILKLLRSAIVLDTVNFSKTAARVTTKDSCTCFFLEELLRQAQVDDDDIPDRDTLFNELVKARADIGSLSASQLLRKDMKLLQQRDVKIAMPGFPITVAQYIHKYQDEAKEAIEELAREMTGDVMMMVLIGMYVDDKDNNVHRDLALINPNGQSDELMELVQQHLLNMKEPPLNLESIEVQNFMLSGSFYRQNNLRATRKHILPVVQQALEEYCHRKAMMNSSPPIQQ